MKIMIIDDEVFYQKYLRTLLESEEYEILVATDASEASRIIEKEIPDVDCFRYCNASLVGFQIT